ncbi:MAG: ribosome biogenesis GTPase YlqF [Erysipelotrichaceae bacterium]|nr:ribosome biogenesis GTPase YlqF [Erysipelotrichaceae bacterium]
MSENKSNINWFPGHMTKAKRQMEEALKGADMVIELRDARVPQASANPLLEYLIQGKPRVILLTKADKADESETKKWTKKFQEEHNIVLSLDVLKDNLIAPLSKACKEAMAEKHAKQKARGINPRATRAMVVGIPNVGKSTLINRMAKRKAAKVANMPGVTRSISVISVSNELQLLDTPGVLWPKFEDQDVAYLLAIIGSINDNIINLEDVALYALDILRKHYPDSLKERYGIEITTQSALELLQEIGKNCNDYSQGEWESEKTVSTFLNDLRNDRLGRITWEVYE